MSSGICNDPNCYNCKLPLWVQASSTSLSVDVQKAGIVVQKHQKICGINHVPCESRNELYGYKARCCICHEHENCDYHVIGPNGKSLIQTMKLTK